jgi:hypothetical protein
MRLGQPDSALALLEQGAALRAAGFSFVATDPAFETIRDLPRFRSILARMDLDPASASPGR